MKVYAWPYDLTQPLIETQTDTLGRYSLTLPESANGKDLVIITEKTQGASTIRLSTILPDVQSARTDVDLDAATTLTAETVAFRGRTNNVTNLSASAVATVHGEIVGWSGLQNVDLTAGGAVLPTVFGNGLKAGDAANFIQGNTIITQALNGLASGADADVQQARRMVQMLRDMLNGIASPAKVEADNLETALDEQRQAISDGTQSASDFSVRTRFLGDVLGLNKNDFSAESLVDREPGQYEQKLSAGVRILERTGNAPDTKSWVVESSIPGLTQNMELTLTPQNTIPVFRLNPTAGKLTLTVRKTGDAALRYDGTLTATNDGTGTPTRVNADITMQDAALTQAIHFTGAMTGLPVTGSTGTNPVYRTLTFNGTITSQFGSATVGNLAAQWFTSTNQEDLQSIQLSNLQASTAFSKTATLTLNSATVLMQNADPTNGFPNTTPSTATFTGSLTGSGYTLSATGMEVGFTRFAKSGGGVTLVPRRVKGAVNFTGTTLSFNGNVDGQWENPVQSVVSGMPLTQFPKGSIRFTGSVTPRFGTVSNADVTLTSGVTTTGNVKVTVNRWSYGSDNITGSVTSTYSAPGGVVQGDPAVAATLTHAPTGVQMVYPSDGNTGRGKMVKGTTKLADIGKAGDLGLGDLGANTLVIKYRDNTFETLASILP